MGEVNPLISLWIVSSLLGLAVSTYGLIEAFKDTRAVAGLTNGRRLVARQRLFAMGIRSAAFFLWSAVGITSIGADPRLTAAIIVLVIVNVAWTALAVSDVYVGWRLRNG